MEEIISLGKYIILTHHNETLSICFCRYDYEECDSESANKMMDHLENLISSGNVVGKEFSSGDKVYVVKVADNFSYVDPIDKSVAKNQVTIAKALLLFLLLIYMCS